jgi:hypothetical protein
MVRSVTMDFGDFGWRDVVLLALAAAGAYLAVTLLRLGRLRRGQVPPAGRDLIFVSATGAATAPTKLESQNAETFSGHLAWAALAGEVTQLRAEVAALRGELTAIKTTRRVSPLYGEALALAQRGFDARGIADECGISVAEAELVLALSRDGKDVDHGGDNGRIWHDAASSGR